MRLRPPAEDNEVCSRVCLNEAQRLSNKLPALEATAFEETCDVVDVDVVVSEDCTTVVVLKLTSSKKHKATTRKRDSFILIAGGR